ncbi:MAG: hypothetical protein A3A65_05530 [Candidatus Chisholmbacteria bacterium RIFCSPLOWO2_01_FULL_49_14]|uniref:Carbamoyltransferase n=1 Tax=Candidatus Chisholmbacteria bacterium RIFCSPLOWO2_01_FULL_49_14 TaxID=1797593 RepID=A0A1G1W1L6_9BACT|nr:MAG: hypothetical protein A3A65_05530 [Candidatus Chisholmbacteria bacterium RIFCSPLOWO2_01_FULL_49_14]
MRVLGITTNHNASAALLINGKVVACASEERFTRRKNQTGIPKAAINFCLSEGKLLPRDLDRIAVADLLSAPLPGEAELPQSNLLSWLTKVAVAVEEFSETRFPSSRKLFYALESLPLGMLRLNSQNRRLKNLLKILPVEKNRFKFIDHHTCHAYAALFASPFLKDMAAKKKRILILTADGAGDRKSATVSLYRNGRISEKHSIDSQQSLGFFYLHVTKLLGMKPIEDEHKVMGLAPYATDKLKITALYNKLAHLIQFDEFTNTWKMPVNTYLFASLIPKLMGSQRFDHVAAVAQRLTEDHIVRWVKRNLTKWKTRTLAVGGGVFANVKVNQKIASLPQVNNVFFMPSPGDETNAIGAAYFLFVNTKKRPHPRPLAHLYLGPSWSESQIALALSPMRTRKNLRLRRPKNIAAEVARLLADGAVVARFAGRMEFGARALGNRSILAHPKHREVVERINTAIKNRDFWMPFAPTIIRKYAGRYIRLHKADSPFMNVAFQTTQVGQRDVAAAIHPYDKTTRPQLLDEDVNPSYYAVIEEFRRLTGIAAVLNTSFNLHGEPIVASPADALKVFFRSGLRHLAIGSWLVSKQ